MSVPATKRIDAGVPRGKRIKPSDLEREARQQARNSTGTFLAIHTKEQRQAVIADALVMLQQGLTTDDIGAKHGVSGQAVRLWLVAAQEDAGDARTLFYSLQQVRFLDEIDRSDSPLALARARECFSGWHKLAQVRDPKNFGQRDHVTVEVSTDLGERLRRANERMARTIEAEIVVSAQHAAPLLSEPAGAEQVIDKPDGVSI